MKAPTLEALRDLYSVSPKGLAEKRSVEEMIIPEELEDSAKWVRKIVSAWNLIKRGFCNEVKLIDLASQRKDMQQAVEAASKSANLKDVVFLFSEIKEGKEKPEVCLQIKPLPILVLRRSQMDLRWLETPTEGVSRIVSLSKYVQKGDRY